MFGFGRKEQKEMHAVTEAAEQAKRAETHESQSSHETHAHHGHEAVKAQPHKKITKDTMIGEAAMMCPDAPEIMLSFGLHCIGCGMTAYETIEQGCMGHGMPEEIISKLVDELNEAMESYEKEAAKHSKH